jgi:hypothetical protein
VRDWNSWQELHSDLLECNWLGLVGTKPLEQPVGCNFVESWEQAHFWACSDVSWWCINEASNVLSMQLSNRFKFEYRKWNDHIQSFSIELDTLVLEFGKRIPAMYRQEISLWIRSHLTSGYLECIYGQLVEISLVRNQMQWYFQGHFPCGWDCPSEVGFPDEATIVVY